MPAPICLKAIPLLASLDIGRSVAFYVEKLGFVPVFAEAGVYGIVARDDCEIHFWACTDRHIAENTGCRINVAGIDALYEAALARNIVHPNGALAAKPWGSREFTVLDPDGNAVAFAEFDDPF